MAYSADIQREISNWFSQTPNATADQVNGALAGISSADGGTPYQYDPTSGMINWGQDQYKGSAAYVAPPVAQQTPPPVSTTPPPPVAASQPEWAPVIDQWISGYGAAGPTLNDVNAGLTPYLDQGARYDPYSGQFSMNGQTYNPGNWNVEGDQYAHYRNEATPGLVGSSQTEQDIRSGNWDNTIQQLVGAQNTGQNLDSFLSQNQTLGQLASWDTYSLDDQILRMLGQGMTPESILKVVTSQGATPGDLETMSKYLNIGGTPESYYKDWTGDQWLQNMPDGGMNQGSVNPFARDWLNEPYNDMAGQGDAWQGLTARGYESPFVSNIVTRPDENIRNILGSDLSQVGSQFFNVSDPFSVSGVGQTPEAIRDYITQQYGVTDSATMSDIAQYLFGTQLSGWTGGPQGPLDSTNVLPPPTPNSGDEWRDTVTSSGNINNYSTDEEIYNHMMEEASSGDSTLASLEREMGLNPGQIMAFQDEAIRYAQEHGLPIPQFPLATTANAPYLNYGFGPGQRLFSRTGEDGTSVVNPISAYLSQIYNQRQVPEEEPVTAAKGGRIQRKKPAGALNAIHQDPVIKRYLKPTQQGGGQDDKIPALLANNEYVFDADVVAALGDGNPDEGARKLDKMRANIRTHKRAAPASKIPPKAKAPEQYLKGR